MFRLPRYTASPDGALGLTRCGHSTAVPAFRPTEPSTCCDTASAGPGPQTMTRWRMASNRPIPGVPRPGPMPAPQYRTLRAAVMDLTQGMPIPSPQRDDALSDSAWNKLPTYRLRPMQWHRIAALVHAIAPAASWASAQHMTTEGCIKVVHTHGPRGIALLELALPVVRIPAELSGRLDVIDRMVYADEAAIWALRPLLGHCERHAVRGAFLPQVFDYLAQSPDPEMLALRINRTLRSADSVMNRLGSRSKEMWFALSCAQPAHTTDTPWLCLVAPPILTLIERVDTQTGHQSEAYLEATQSLVAMVGMPDRERIPFFRLCRPLMGQPLQPTRLAGLLLLFASSPHPVRAKVADVLEFAGALGPQDLDTLVKRTRMVILTPHFDPSHLTAEEPR